MDYLKISDGAKKRLLQSGFLAGMAFADSKYAYAVKDLPEEDIEEITRELGELFKKYGLSDEVV